MKKIALAFLLCSATLLLLSCQASTVNSGSGSSGSSSFTLSGTLTFTTVSPNGHTAQLKLVTHGGSSTATALYSVSAVFSGNTANYSISGIAAGTYTGWAFIDMNNSGGSQPDTGDYYATSDISISGNNTSDIPNTAWIYY